MNDTERWRPIRDASNWIYAGVVVTCGLVSAFQISHRVEMGCWLAVVALNVLDPGSWSVVLRRTLLRLLGAALMACLVASYVFVTFNVPNRHSLGPSEQERLLGFLTTPFYVFVAAIATAAGLTLRYVAWRIAKSSR